MLSKTINKTRYKGNTNFNNHNNNDANNNNDYNNNNKEIDLINVDNFKINNITRLELNECNNISSSNNNNHEILNSNGKQINGTRPANEESKFDNNNNNNNNNKQKNHNSDKINYINCPICRKLFKNKNTYALHRKKFHYNSGSNDNNNNNNNNSDGKIITCKICAKKFKNKKSHSRHYSKWHVLKIPLNKCNKCNKEFSLLENLKLHNILYHHVDQFNNNTAGNSKLIKCPKCDKSFSRISAFHGHIPKHYVADNFECKKCGEIFKYKRLLMVHKKTVHYKFNKNHLPQSSNVADLDKNLYINPIHKCQICDITFEEFHQLDRHANSQHKDKRPHKCKICKKNYSQKSLLNLHMYCHNGLRPHVCQICYISFEQREILMAHINCCHHNNKTDEQNNGIHSTTTSSTTSATTCTTTTTSATEPITGITTNINSSELYAETLPNNKIIYHNIKLQLQGNKRKYICIYCAKEFNRPSDALRHLRIHTKEKPYTCDICSKSFAVKHSINAHMRVHNKPAIVPHVIRKTLLKSCQICSLKFNTIDELNKHNVMHSKQLKSLFGDVDIESDIKINIEIEEPVELNENNNNNCNKDDANNNQMYGDNNIMGNDDKKKRKQNNKYQCEICNNIFTHSMQLRKHLLDHTDENAFVCEHCGKKYSTKRVLQNHKKTHLENKPFKCSVCSAEFVSASDLKRHGSVHLTKKNCMCPYCKKLFKSTYNCKRHLKLHKIKMLTELKKDILNGNITINEMEKEFMNRVNIDDDDAVDDGYDNNIDNIKNFFLKPVDELELKLEPYEYELIKQQIDFEQELIAKKQIENELKPMEECVNVPNESEVTLLNKSIEELEPYEHELIEQQVEFEQELIEQQKCINDIIEPENKNTNQTIIESIPLHESELIKDQQVPHDAYELIKNKEITPQNHCSTQETIESQDEYLNEAVKEFESYERELIEQQVELIVRQNCVTNGIVAKQEYFDQTIKKPPTQHKCHELIIDKSEREHDELITNKEITTETQQNDGIQETIESQDEYLNEAVKALEAYEHKLIEQQLNCSEASSMEMKCLQKSSEFKFQVCNHTELTENVNDVDHTNNNSQANNNKYFMNPTITNRKPINYVIVQMDNDIIKENDLQFENMLRTPTIIDNDVEIELEVFDEVQQKIQQQQQQQQQQNNAVINSCNINNAERLSSSNDKTTSYESKERVTNLDENIQQQAQQKNGSLLETVKCKNLGKSKCKRLPKKRLSKKKSIHKKNYKFKSSHKIYKCVYCDTAFRKFTNLKRHACKLNEIQTANINKFTNSITLSKSKQFDCNVLHKEIVELSNGTENIKQIEKKTSVDIYKSNKSQMRFHNSHNITNANQTAELILNDNGKQKQQEANAPHQLNSIFRNAQQQQEQQEQQEQLPALVPINSTYTIKNDFDLNDECYKNKTEKFVKSETANKLIIQFPPLISINCENRKINQDDNFLPSENIFSSNLLLNDLSSVEKNDIKSSFTDVRKTNVLNVNSLVNYSDRQTSKLSPEHEYLIKDENNNLKKSETLLQCKNIRNDEEKQSTQTTGQLLMKQLIVENQNNCRASKPFTNVTTYKTFTNNSNEQSPAAIYSGTKKKKILIEVTSDIILQKDDLLYKEIQKDLQNIYGIDINKITANNNNLSNKSNESRRDFIDITTSNIIPYDKQIITSSIDPNDNIQIR